MTDALATIPPRHEDPVVIGGRAILQDRRRPGRLQNPAPELVALMRKPSAPTAHQVALFDAPNFVPPAPTPDAPDLGHFLRFTTAFAVCATAWMVMLKTMVVLWG